MSLRRLVVELLRERGGSGTVDDLMPVLSLKGFTRPQASKALAHASSDGYLHGIQVPKAGRPCQGARPATYFVTTKKYADAVKKEPPLPMVASVFDLASTEPIAIPKSDGTVYQLLGPWTDSEELASNDSRKAA